jgi:acetyl esterase/lipase
MIKLISLLFSTLLFLQMHAQKEISLYQNKIPNGIDCNIKEFLPIPGRVAGVTKPTLTIYFPEKQDSLQTAVIICPGGGYTRLAIEHEGHEVAKKFNELGIIAFVLKYRIPNDTCMTNKEIVPLQDAQRAIQLVRENAVEWKVNANKIGIMGFSAGGHLASTVGTHFTETTIDNPKQTSLRPDFLVLAYPVISFDKTIAHRGSRNSLIGTNPSQAAVVFFSNELQVTAQTPITFILHASDDLVVPVENSIRFYEALQKNKVPAEIHIYEKGGHGFGLHNKTTKDEWFERLINWMKANKVINDINIQF